MTERIYVQIPAYRDRQLLPTVRHLVATADRPERLRIAIAWQYDDADAHLEPLLRRCGNVELVKIPARRSKGCNWARRLLQERWDNEPYTLFLDSHHRFVDGWDSRIIDLYETCRGVGVAKPILTAYLPPYDPDNDPDGRTQCVFRIHVLERREGMVFRLVGHPMSGWRELTAPVPAHFVSLHFLFTGGLFNKEVPFDPAIYFFADEVAVALRAYSLGYDLFHPHCILGWHLYDRSTRVTHWTDHADAHLLQARSLQRLRDLYTGRLSGNCGLGQVRGIRDYEKLAGLSLTSR